MFAFLKIPFSLKFPFSKENFFDAIREILSVLFFGFMPIILGLLFAWLSPNGGVTQFALGFLASGEALLLSTALVGPLIYVLFKNYGNFPNLSSLIKNYDKFPGTISIQFPYGWSFISLIILICVIAAGVFGYNSALSENDKLLSENMRILSIIILSSSLSIFFLISVVRNNLVDGAAKIMSADTNDFLKDWDKG